MFTLSRQPSFAALQFWLEEIRAVNIFIKVMLSLLPYVILVIIELLWLSRSDVIFVFKFRMLLTDLSLCWLEQCQVMKTEKSTTMLL